MILFKSCLSRPVCNGGWDRSCAGKKSSADMDVGHDGNVYHPSAWQP